MKKIDWKKVYKIIESPVSKKFEKEFFSRRVKMLDERIAAYDPIKAAEVLRDIRDEFFKAKESPTWNHYLKVSMGSLTAMMMKSENIEEQKAKIILIAKFTRKKVKDLEKQYNKKIN